VIEPTETLTVRAATDAALVAPGGGTVTILDEDAAPVVTSTSAPASARVGTTAAVRVDFTDQDLPDRHGAVVEWGDGTSSPGSVAEGPGRGSATAGHAYAAAGLYTPRVTVTDAGGGRTVAVLPFVAVFDPAAGRLNATGRIGTDAGPKFVASAGYPSKGAVPTGSVSLEAVGLSLSSTSLDWLVVTGSRAAVAGRADVNGRSGYRFVASVSGGAQPRVRVRVVDPAGAVVFDSEPGAPLDGLPGTPLVKGKVTVG
jgi:hypothetical protein